VRWLAKGYWGNHFNWRIHPKARPAFIISGIALLVLAILAIVSMVGVGVDIVTGNGGVATVQTNPVPSAAIMMSMLVFIASLLWGFFLYAKERDDFVDLAIQRWEEDETLPDRGTVTDFVNKGG